MFALGFGSGVWFLMIGLSGNATMFIYVPQTNHLYGPWSNGIWSLPIGAIGATDGSGGTHSSDPRLRRVGWGAVVFVDYSKAPLGYASGHVEGAQTVPRSELYGLVWFASHTSGDIEVAIDAKYVVKGFHKGKHKLHTHHVDLWVKLWHAIGHREGRLTVLWVKSHAENELDSVIDLYEDIPVWAFVLNKWADNFADEASLRHQLPDSVARLVKGIDAKANKVLGRLAAVCEAWVDNAGETDRLLTDPPVHQHSKIFSP